MKFNKLQTNVKPTNTSLPRMLHLQSVNLFYRLVWAGIHQKKIKWQNSNIPRKLLHSPVTMRAHRTITFRSHDTGSIGILQQSLFFGPRAKFLLGVSARHFSMFFYLLFCYTREILQTLPTSMMLSAMIVTTLVHFSMIGYQKKCRFIYTFCTFSWFYLRLKIVNIYLLFKCRIPKR